MFRDERRYFWAASPSLHVEDYIPVVFEPLPQVLLSFRVECTYPRSDASGCDSACGADQNPSRVLSPWCPGCTVANEGGDSVEEGEET